MTKQVRVAEPGWYIANKEVLTTGLEHLSKWKVIVSSANAGGQSVATRLPS